jgi:hypothetical protein
VLLMHAVGIAVGGRPHYEAWDGLAAAQRLLLIEAFMADALVGRLESSEEPVDQVTQPEDRRDGPHFTIRHMFLTVAWAALGILARRLLGPVSVTWSWVAFGAILFGGITAVSADAGSATHVARWRTLPRIVLMMCVGGLFGFIMSLS